MITETETAFLAAIRAFLAGEEETCETLSKKLEDLTEKQWNHLLVLASQHSLLAAVYDVVGKTPAFLRLPEAFRYSVKMEAGKSVMQQVSRTARFLMDEKELENRGVRPLVIKGIVCRSLYPKPDLRPSGDEDLLVLPEDFATVDAYLISKGYQKDKENKKEENRKTGCRIPEEMGYFHPKTGVLYEIHTHLFSEESAAYGFFNEAFAGVAARAVSLEIQGQTIWTLEATDHLFYLLCHSFKHFLHGGVGIRQICDMVQMIRRFGQTIDWERFWKLCEQYHMVCFCVNLLDIGERYLGFSYEMCGAERYMKKLEPDSEALLADILDAGSFGKTSEGRVHSANITLYAAKSGNQEGMRGGIWNSLFPEVSYIRQQYPFSEAHPFLLPAAYLLRIFRWCCGQKDRKKEKSSITVGEERVALLKKYDMIRTTKKGGHHAG